MKRIAFVAMLLLGYAFAYGQPGKKQFPPVRLDPNIRDFIKRPYGTVTIEVEEADGYNLLSNIDSIFELYEKDIAFYKDSLARLALQGIDIDYDMDLSTGLRKLRFKTRDQEGDFFAIKNGETARLKVLDDTIRFWMIAGKKEEWHVSYLNSYSKGAAASIGGNKTRLWYNTPTRALMTISMNTINDFVRVTTDKALQQAIDTLKATIPPAVRQNRHRVLSRLLEPEKGIHRSVRTLAAYPNEVYALAGKDRLEFNISGGVGAIRNILTPQTELVLTFNRRGVQKYIQSQVYTLSVQQLFFFRSNSNGDYTVQDNWFVNFEYGTKFPRSASQFPDPPTLGVGYLVRKNGTVFKNTTAKVFLNFQVGKNDLYVTPELIFTDNFRQIFPAFNVKVRL